MTNELKTPSHAIAFGFYLAVTAPTAAAAADITSQLDSLLPVVDFDTAAACSIVGARAAATGLKLGPEHFPQELPPLEVIHAQQERDGVNCVCIKCDPQGTNVAPAAHPANYQSDRLP